jgi:hypothetical protein
LIERLKTSSKLLQTFWWKTLINFWNVFFYLSVELSVFTSGDIEWFLLSKNLSQPTKSSSLNFLVFTSEESWTDMLKGTEEVCLLVGARWCVSIAKSSRFFSEELSGHHTVQITTQTLLGPNQFNSFRGFVKKSSPFNFQSGISLKNGHRPLKFLTFDLISHKAAMKLNFSGRSKLLMIEWRWNDCHLLPF